MHRKRLTMYQRCGCGSEACRDERALAKGCRGELIVPARAAYRAPFWRASTRHAGEREEMNLPCGCPRWAFTS